MRRVGLLLLVALMGLVRANAQEVDSLQLNSENETIESLSAKVKQLQHDYDFFYCETMLQNYMFKLSDLAKDLSCRSNAIQIDAYHSGFDADLYVSYRNQYDSSLSLFESIKENVKVIIDLVQLKFYTSYFTESEIEVLQKMCDDFDYAFKHVEASFNYYEASLNFFRKY